jgi:hypothetical protein
MSCFVECNFLLRLIEDTMFESNISIVWTKQNLLCSGYLFVKMIICGIRERKEATQLQFTPNHAE